MQLAAEKDGIMQLTLFAVDLSKSLLRQWQAHFVSRIFHGSEVGYRVEKSSDRKDGLHHF